MCGRVHVLARPYIADVLVMSSARNQYKVDKFVTSVGNPWVNATAGLVLHEMYHENITKYDGRKVHPISDTFTFWHKDAIDHVDASLTILEIAGDDLHAPKRVFCYYFINPHSQAPEQIWSEQLYFREQFGPDDDFAITFKGFEILFQIKQHYGNSRQMAQFQRWLAQIEAHGLITNLNYRRMHAHEVECDAAYKA